MQRDFNAWLSKFRESIADYKYYINFKKVYENVNWISPIFIIPKFQNKGIASTVIKQLFDIYPNTIEWRLDTIKQETGNCHLYEKCGFIRVGEDTVVNEKMTLVDYRLEKNLGGVDLNDNRRI